MPASQDLQDFLRRHPTAWQFAWKASEDYLLARFGIRRGLWSGFEMATQAIEKLLKSYLLFRDASLGGSEDAVRKAVSAKAKARGRTSELGHDVQSALALAEPLGLACSADLSARVARIDSYYELRYPGGGPQSLAAAEADDVDEAIFEVWDAFEAINPDYFYTTGIMWPLYAFLMDIEHRGESSPLALSYYGFLAEANQSYERRRVRLENGIKERIALWYPPQK
jgi:hypothetical protein